MRNEFKIAGNVALVKLTQGYWAQVDIEDLPLIAGFKWHATVKQTGRVYAKAAAGPKPQKNVKLHRLIMGVTDPAIEVDHEDGDGLNCRRENLRPATRAQNMYNRGPHKNSTTGFKGVVFHKNKDKFEARINLGYFSTAEQAARAVDAAAKTCHKEFARLNFPEEGKAA